MQNCIVPVILSGGSGTRLWPLSRKQLPKQYLPLVTDNTMLQETILRLDGLDNVLDPIIVCNNEHRFLVATQCQQIGLEDSTILLEPFGRGTAPAIIIAALEAIKNGENPTLLVLSADHIIQNIKAFHDAVHIAGERAELGELVTFGIKPTCAHTGYGYIRHSNNNDNVCHVQAFVEKPDAKTAELYIRQGGYLWNSGMFMFKAKTLIKEMKVHSPAIVDFATKALEHAECDLDFIRLDKESFELLTSDSIDCALMEKSDRVVVVPLDAGWSDVGEWSALHKVSGKDKDGNAIIGDAITQDVKNTYIHAKHHMVAAIGLQDMVVVDTPDVTFVSTKGKAKEVGKMVERLQTSGKDEGFFHRKVYRPWGWYDRIDRGNGYQVKSICVKPGGKLSLQSHECRAEHWIVVKGEAKITKGSDVFNLKVNQSTYIEIGEKHSLENNSKSEYLEVIEVQSGTYFGEDDIVRYDDMYDRHLSQEDK